MLVTTNGTLAVVRAARFAREIVLASFVNLSAIVEYVRGRKVAVMPAGNIKGAKSCIEDDGCASSIVGRPHRRCRRRSRDHRGVYATPASSGGFGNEPGLAADIDVCFAVDSVPIVPRVSVDDWPWFWFGRNAKIALGLTPSLWRAFALAKRAPVNV